MRSIKYYRFISVNQHFIFYMFFLLPVKEQAFLTFCIYLDNAYVLLV